jgi:hypothetical protein
MTNREAVARLCNLAAIMCRPLAEIPDALPADMRPDTRERVRRTIDEAIRRKAEHRRPKEH